MCTPTDAIKSVGQTLKFVSNIFTPINTVVSVANDAKYKTQVAINNAKSAENEAMRLQQLGIEESRREKIIGIQNANKLLAQNAAGGMDISSGTNSYAYQDVIDSAYSDAQNTLNDYEYQAQSYFNQANDYISDANYDIASTNNYLLNYAVTGLGNAGLATKEWFIQKDKERDERLTV